MYERILVTLDGSPLSERILPEVEQLIGNWEASVTLLTVAAPPEETAQARPGVKQLPAAMTGSATTTGAEPRLIETVDQAFERVRDELERYVEEKGHALRDKGIAVESVVRFGDPAEEIMACARTYEVDLIMMASHGRTGLGQVIVGSVAGRVLASGVKPMLVVRPKGVE